MEDLISPCALPKKVNNIIIANGSLHKRFLDGTFFSWLLLRKYI